jgi:hypothetical protein
MIHNNSTSDAVSEDRFFSSLFGAAIPGAATIIPFNLLGFDINESGTVGFQIACLFLAGYFMSIFIRNRRKSRVPKGIKYFEIISLMTLCVAGILSGVFLTKINYVDGQFQSITINGFFFIIFLCYFLVVIGTATNTQKYDFVPAKVSPPTIDTTKLDEHIFVADIKVDQQFEWQKQNETDSDE